LLLGGIRRLCVLDSSLEGAGVAQTETRTHRLQQKTARTSERMRHRSVEGRDKDECDPPRAASPSEVSVGTQIIITCLASA